MLRDITCYRKIYIACGRTDIRKGIDGLSCIIKEHFHLDPFQKDTLFLFCGSRTDRIKALLWEGDGFLLMYKRLEDGRFRWPRNAQEAAEISPDQYRRLLDGFEVIETSTINHQIAPKELL